MSGEGGRGSKPNLLVGGEGERETFLGLCFLGEPFLSFLNILWVGTVTSSADFFLFFISLEVFYFCFWSVTSILGDWTGMVCCFLGCWVVSVALGAFYLETEGLYLGRIVTDYERAGWKLWTFFLWFIIAGASWGLDFDFLSISGLGKADFLFEGVFTSVTLTDCF